MRTGSLLLSPANVILSFDVGNLVLELKDKVVFGLKSDDSDWIFGFFERIPGGYANVKLMSSFRSVY